MPRLDILLLILLLSRIGIADPRAKDPLEPVHRVVILHSAMELLFPASLREDLNNGWSWRASVHDEKVTLSVLAEELNVAASASMATDVKQFLSSDTNVVWIVHPPFRQHGLYVVGASSRVKKSLDWTPVYTAFISSADHTVQRLTFSVDSPGTLAPGLWAGISERIVRTARALEHRYDMKAGVRRTPLGSSFEVPDNWVLTLSNLNDTNTAVYGITLMTPFGHQRVGCQFESEGAIPSSASTTRAAGEISGRAVGWVFEHSRSKVLSRTTFELGKYNVGITCEGPDATAETLARRVVSTLHYDEADDIRH